MLDVLVETPAFEHPAGMPADQQSVGGILDLTGI